MKKIAFTLLICFNLGRGPLLAQDLVDCTSIQDSQEELEQRAMELSDMVKENEWLEIQKRKLAWNNVGHKFLGATTLVMAPAFGFVGLLMRGPGKSPFLGTAVMGFGAALVGVSGRLIFFEGKEEMRITERDYKSKKMDYLIKSAEYRVDQATLIRQAQDLGCQLKTKDVPFIVLEVESI